jgi:D-alanyl-D-alanine carboxypeptidase
VWRYSNGNYCALGVLVEFVTGQPLDTAIQQLIFDPLGLDGLHLSTGGLLPTDIPHLNNVGRLSRLGGAGTFVVSTEDLAALVAATTFDDVDTLRPPGVFTDQYGWGHTGTVSGAVSCVWVLELGRTVVAATIAGNSPAKGGNICDLVVPAIADDLAIGQGTPIRTP